MVSMVCGMWSTQNPDVKTVGHTFEKIEYPKNCLNCQNRSGLYHGYRVVKGGQKLYDRDALRNDLLGEHSVNLGHHHQGNHNHAHQYDLSLIHI